MAKTNKSGNMRGMSKGSKNALKKDFTAEERQENGRKGAEITNTIISLKKTLSIAKPKEIYHSEFSNN